MVGLVAPSPRLSASPRLGYPAFVQLSNGGRFTVRLASSSSERVEYAGELVTPSATWAARAVVTLADGAVDVAADGVTPVPEWLVAFARATLRTAWRSSREGTPWPRRVNRWRVLPAAKGAP
jgi:hypothetical protein